MGIRQVPRGGAAVRRPLGVVATATPSKQVIKLQTYQFITNMMSLTADIQAS